MSLLFSPIDLHGITVRNRLWVAPMCQYSAVDGVPNSWHLVHLAQFASGALIPPHPKHQEHQPTPRLSSSCVRSQQQL